MITFDYYKTNKGWFYKAVTVSSFYYFPKDFYFNGVEGQSLQLSSGWLKLDSELKTLQQTKPEQCKTVGFILSNPELASDKIPLELTREQVEAFIDDDNESKWNNFEAVRSLYTKKFEVIPGGLEDIKFESNLRGEYAISDNDDPSKIQVTKVSMLTDNNWGASKVFDVELSNIVSYEEIEKLLIPEFLLHTRPCSLTSKQVYQIVRQFIILNVDPKYAKITSNYDFCFEVKKILKLSEPNKVRKEKLTSRLNSYSPPKYENYLVTNREVSIFKMTWAGYKGSGGYDGYPCIDGWYANSLQELADNMKRYLDELMEKINESLEDCPHCKGQGVIVKHFGVNER